MCIYSTTGFSHQCQLQTVEISITSIEWNESLAIRMFFEFETLESDLLSEVCYLNFSLNALLYEANFLPHLAELDFNEMI